MSWFTAIWLWVFAALDPSLPCEEGSVAEEACKAAEESPSAKGERPAQQAAKRQGPFERVKFISNGF